MAETPLIKGMFVNSHIRALRVKKGTDGVRELERRYGSPLAFKNLADVPVREEIRILELVLDLLSDVPVPPESRSFEAGRLHFRNFITTPFGKILISAIPKTIAGFHKLLTSTGHIARHVFKNTNFRATHTDSMISICMDNSDYPLEHFRGLFFEWMVFWDMPSPSVEATENAPGAYEYTLRWQS